MADTRGSTSKLEALHRVCSPHNTYHANEFSAVKLALPRLKILHSFEVVKSNMRGH